MKLVRRQLPLDVYNRAITFLYGTVEQINAVLCRDLGDDKYALRKSNRGKWVCVERDGYQSDYICVTRHGSMHGRIANLSHECLHCALNVMRVAGVKITAGSEEALTYYHQWLLIQCLLVMRGSSAKH